MTDPLLPLATFLGGLLAGVNADRLVVQMPAWRRLGPSAWAAYSRRADLGNAAWLYPPLAFGAAVLNLVAAVRFPSSAAATSAVCAALACAVAARASVPIRCLGDERVTAAAEASDRRRVTRERTRRSAAGRSVCSTRCVRRRRRHAR